MNRTCNAATLAAIAAALGLAFSAATMAGGMSKDEFKAAQKKIDVDYQSAKSGCDGLQANGKDICLAGAKGTQGIARAELMARHKPGAKAHHDVRIAKAQADYEVAKEKCDDLAGNAKDVCAKQAEAVHTGARADARAQLKIVDARKEAASDKQDAEYAVAIEKCDAMAGEAKTNCVRGAKARFGKS